MKTGFIQLRLNGEARRISPLTTVAELLQSFQMDPRSVVVERNRQVIPREEFDRVTVEEGDEIEVVHFVGGGKGGAENLVIVESPTKAKTLLRYLGPAYQIEASMGHVRDLPKGRMGIDLEHEFKPDYVVMTKAKKTVTRIKKEAKGKKAVYLAPDPDREGEAISWHLAAILQGETDGKIHRVVFNEITPDAVREAFKHPRTIDDKLVNAQQARR